MQIQEVTTPAHWRIFYQVPHYIYANDPHWIAPLEGDIDKIFSPASNKAFEEGKAKVWVLLDAAGKGIGRISAFIDGRRNAKIGREDGGIGFFECVNDDEAAKLLFDTAEAYLAAEGISMIHAPINFGERDKFWGLLTKGWYPPLYHEYYHPQYYQRFFNARNYQPQEQVFTFGGKVENLAFERLTQISGRVRERYNVQSRVINLRDLRTEGDHMATVYNSAFANMPHFKPLEGEQIYKMLKMMKPVMDPNLTCISFAGDEPVGFCALMPDINRSLKFAKGKLSWWKMPRFLYNLKYSGQPNIVKGVAFGIHADYQRRGVFSEMVDFLTTVGDGHNLKTYKELGLATIRGGNYAMLKSSTAALNVFVERVHLSFVKILDETPYEPYGSSDVSEVPMGEVPPEGIYPKG
ncbi:hypothetical protein [Lewinella cohaerens]|uniref:hypothetical protein n=1 Tax=Lewinella cohaerens TaxID=70995 RepID=UPI00036C60E3|nr:hypothetical protein [Lewinella cohaerens]